MLLKFLPFLGFNDLKFATHDELDMILLIGRFLCRDSAHEKVFEWRIRLSRTKELRTWSSECIRTKRFPFERDAEKTKRKDEKKTSNPFHDHPKRSITAG